MIELKEKLCRIPALKEYIESSEKQVNTGNEGVNEQ